MLLSAEKISISFLEKKILDDVNVYIDYKEKISIIGRNGCGKSTLLKILAGEIDNYSGTVTIKPLDKISYLQQDFNVDEEITVYNYLNSYGISKEYEIKTILTKLGIFTFDKKLKELSGGEKKRVMLARALVQPCELLILDEPTNHLDIEMVAWLEKYLQKFNKAIILVTHDRYFLERVVSKILEIKDGKIRSYEANYQKYLEAKLIEEEIEIASERKKQAFLRKELQWLRQGPQGRQSKDKRRIAQYEALKEKHVTIKEELQINAPSSRLGKKTIIIDNITKSINNKTLFSNFSYEIENDDRIGIVGSNGSGKTTFLNLLALLQEPDKGNIVHGPTVKIGYFTQEGEELDVNIRVIDYLNEVSKIHQVEDQILLSSQMLEMFLFPKEMHYQAIRKLSGGEKRRLYLLKILMTAPNILLLDEPTNDLDIDTLNVLESYLNSFNGAVIIVSHDRYFLDKTVNKIFAIENQKITKYNGGYTDYINQKPKIEVTVPTKRVVEKITIKKLTYQEKQELATIEDEITNLENQLTKLITEINENYHNYQKVAPLLEQQKILEDTIEKKYQRWEELEEKNRGN